MTNKNLFKEAHKMARKIKSEYPEVDYKFQFGLCLSYLLNKGEINMINKNEVLEKEVNKTYNLVTNKGTKVELTIKTIKSTLHSKATLEISKLKYNGHIEYDLVGKWNFWSMTDEPVIVLEDDREILVRNNNLIKDVHDLRNEASHKLNELINLQEK